MSDNSTNVINAPEKLITQIQGNFLFLSNFLDEIFEIFTSTYYLSEFFINIFFIFLVLIITIIIYWDNINRKVSENSRCKKQIDIYDKSKGVYLIEANDKNKNKLFDIKYILGAKRNSVECKCAEGDVVNNFTDIRIRDLKNNRTINNFSKTCSCDRFYDIGVGNEIIYSGDPGIVRYMDTSDTTFFDSYYDIQYS